MDNLGVAMNVTKMSAYAEALGKVWKEMSSAEQAELAMQYFFENTEKYAGNFQKESVSTISGSIGQLKSAWGDLMAGMASPDADLGQMTDNVVGAFENVVTNLTPVADRLVQTIPELITRLGPVIMEKAPELLAKGKELMIQFFEGIRMAFGEFDITAFIQDLLYALLPQEMADRVITFFSDIFQTISDMDWETISSVIAKVAEGAVKLIDFISQHGGEVAAVLGVIVGIGIAGEIISIVTAIGPLLAGLAAFNPIVALVAAGIVALMYVMTHWQEISEKAKEIWAKVTEVVGEKWEQLKDKLSQVWDAIKNAAAPAWELIKTVILGPVLLLCDLVTGDFDKLKEDADKIWEKIKENVDKIVQKLQETVGAKFDELKEIVPQKVGEMKDAVVQTVTDLKDAFFEKIQEIISDAPTWGADIIQGIIDGITGGISYVQGAVSDVAQGIRDFIGFSEPDKGPLSDFHTYMPDMINLMASGITRGLPALRDAANQAAGVLAGSLDMTSGLRGQQLAFAGAGGNSVSYGGVNVNVYGAEGQDVEALADIVSDRIIELARREA